MFALSFYLPIISLFLVAYAEQMMKNVNNYGPYNLEFSNFRDCKGPKAKNLTVMSISLDEFYVGVVNITFLADTKIEEIKINVFNIKNDKKNFLWNYKLNDPCKHYSFAILIKQELNADNCLVKKGFYSSKLNFKEITASFLGTSFFYGNYTFKADLISKKRNIGCFVTTLVFSKKT